MSQPVGEFILSLATVCHASKKFSVSIKDKLKEDRGRRKLVWAGDSVILIQNESKSAKLQVTQLQKADSGKSVPKESHI